MKDRIAEEIQRENERKLDELLRAQERSMPSRLRQMDRKKRTSLNPHDVGDFDQLLEDLARISR